MGRHHWEQPALRHGHRWHCLRQWLPLAVAHACSLHSPYTCADPRAYATTQPFTYLQAFLASYPSAHVDTCASAYARANPLTLSDAFASTFAVTYLNPATISAAHVLSHRHFLSNGLAHAHPHPVPYGQAHFTANLHAAAHIDSKAFLSAYGVFHAGSYGISHPHSNSKPLEYALSIAHDRSHWQRSTDAVAHTRAFAPTHSTAD